MTYYVFKQVNKNEKLNLKEFKEYEHPTWQLLVVSKEKKNSVKV